MASFRARMILLGLGMLLLIGIQIYRIHFDSGPLVLAQDQVTVNAQERDLSANKQSFPNSLSKRFPLSNAKHANQKQGNHKYVKSTDSTYSEDSRNSREHTSEKRKLVNAEYHPQKIKKSHDTVFQNIQHSNKRWQPNPADAGFFAEDVKEPASFVPYLAKNSSGKKEKRIKERELDISPLHPPNPLYRGESDKTRKATLRSSWIHTGELGSDYEYYNISWRRVSLITDNITIDISRYMNGRPVYRAPVLVHNPKLCDVDGGGLYLLVMVPSLPRHHETRAVIRETWASPAYNGGMWAGRRLNDKVKLVFVFGGTNYTDDDKSILRSERKRYQDILVMDFVDSYQNLSIKMANSLFWTGSHCKGVRHVLKVDEDTYVHLPQMISLIKRVEKITDSFILGHQHTHENPAVVRKGKWRVGLEYLLPFYPRYIIGHSYVVSGHALPSILNTLKKIPGIKNEDAFITGIVAKLNSIPRLHSRAFAGTFYKQVLCNVTRGYYVSLTYCCKEHLRTLYRHAVEGKCDRARFDHIPTRKCRFFRHLHPLEFLKKTNGTKMQKPPSRDDVKQLEQILNFGASLIGGVGKKRFKDEEYEDTKQKVRNFPSDDGEIKKSRSIQSGKTVLLENRDIAKKAIL